MSKMNIILGLNLSKIMAKLVTRVTTQHIPGLLSSDRGVALYEYFRENIEWEDGVRSKSGETRKAKAMAMGLDDVLDAVIVETMALMNMNQIGIFGIYLNYYRNGIDYTPNHSHPGMKQVIISLGAPRTLNVGTKSYIMGNGDVIIFGSATHGVPKDPNCTEGRISIALFLQK
jgi:hypothetical protein